MNIIMKNKLLSLVFLCFLLSTPLLNGKSSYVNNNNVWWLEKINQENLDLCSYMEREVIVAVIDSGIDFSHSELLNSQWFNEDELYGIEKYDDDNNGFIDDISGWDFVEDDNFTGNAQDDPIYFHGSFITGIIVSQNLGLGLNVKILPIRILNVENIVEVDSWDTLASAIDYAVEMNAEIINFSIMLTANTTVVYNAIQNAYESGVSFVTVTGNSNPLFGGIDSISYPGKLNNTICVGATNYNDERADYSNYGNEIDFVAPVGDYYTSSTKKINSTSLNNEYIDDVGTSYAVPQVTGAIALLKGINNSLSNQEIYNLLRETSTDLGDEGWDKQYGHGIINLDKAVDLLLGGIIEERKESNLNIIVSVVTLALISRIKNKEKKLM